MIDEIKLEEKIKEKIQRKIVTGCSGPTIWIEVLIKHYVGWRWRKERT